MERLWEEDLHIWESELADAEKHIQKFKEFKLIDFQFNDQNFWDFETKVRQN